MSISHPLYSNVVGVIIAGGKGKRMKTDIPKPFVLLNKKPIIWYSFQLLNNLGIDNRIVSVSAKNNEYFIKSLTNIDSKAQCIPDSAPMRGNATGLASVIPILPNQIKHILVIHPDSSCLIKAETILPALQKHIENDLTATFSVKEKDLAEAQKATNNQEFEPKTASIFIFKKNRVKELLEDLKIDPKTNEYRIEYLFEYAKKKFAESISLFPIPTSQSININSPEDLKQAEQMIKK